MKNNNRILLCLYLITDDVITLHKNVISVLYIIFYRINFSRQLLGNGYSTRIMVYGFGVRSSDKLVYH